MRDWDALPSGMRAALEEQWAALAAGGLACGSSVTDASGAVVARGHNRAYDEPTGTDPLEGTPLAHAEMNALARVGTRDPLDEMTFWCTQRPCAMCSAALDFVGAGRVVYLGEDPSDAAQSDLPWERLDDEGWQAVTTALFLERDPASPLAAAARSGLDLPVALARLDLSGGREPT